MAGILLAVTYLLSVFPSPFCQCNPSVIITEWRFAGQGEG